MKQLEAEYDARHRVLVHQYESIIQAQKVNIEDIPLPSYLPGAPGEYEASLAAIELPIENLTSSLTAPMPPPKSILKAANAIPIEVDLPSLTQKFPRPPPGPPPSAVPDLTDFECDDDELELGIRADEPYRPNDMSKKIRFGGEVGIPAEPVIKPTSYYNQAKQPTLPAAPNKPPLMPPVSAATAKQPYGSYQNYAVPPPPPQQHQHHQHQQPQTSQANSQYARLQQLANKPTSAQQASGPATTTIEAKPVLRNKAAETTKFVPTSLLVRRDANKKPDLYHSHQQQQQNNAKKSNAFYDSYPSSASSYYNSSQPILTNNNNSQSSGASKNTKSTDEDYEKFMNEIGKLL